MNQHEQRLHQMAASTLDVDADRDAAVWALAELNRNSDAERITMKATIRVSGDRTSGSSTHAELEILHDGELVRLTPDASGNGVASYSMRPAEARVVAAAINEAAALAELNSTAGGNGHG